MKKAIAFTAATAFAFVASIACAQNADTGWYAGIGVGGSNFSDNIPSQIRADGANNQYYSVTSALTTDDSGKSAQIFVGYKFLPWLGAELGYQDLGGAGIHYSLQAIDSPPIKPTYDGRYGAHDVNATLVATWPIASNFELYARGGAAYTRLAFSASGINEDRQPAYFRAPTVGSTEPIVGIGAQWRFMPAFALRLDLSRVFDVGKVWGPHIDTNGRFDDIDAYTLNFVWMPGANR